jgi:hypothetical protein
VAECASGSCPVEGFSIISSIETSRSATVVNFMGRPVSI